MKKAICLLVLFCALLLGSVSVLADPKGEPGSGTEEPTLIYIGK